jgi:DNA-binding beta-propeller fold protein YncE
MNDNARMTCPIVAAPTAALAMVFMIFCTHALAAQGNPPKYEVDPSWPRPLPNKWVTGAVSGVCTDAQDHVFIVNRGNLTENELDSGRQAPPVIEFDPQGNVANSWGNREALPEGLHGCFVDYQGNVWLAGSDDTFVQKYSHDGSKLLLQIGQKGVADSSDGTIQGIALNSSHTGFYRPSAITVDPGNGDVYVADGEEPGSNHRVAVFDRNGRFLRQWVLHRTKAEMEAGEGDEFMQVPHCVAIGNDGLVYVCDRRGDRVQVFDKMGTFQKDILVPYEKRSQNGPRLGHVPRAWGTVEWLGFSADRVNKFMYVVNEDNEQVDTLDRSTGKVLSTFGRAGHQVGGFTFAHTLAVDSKNNVYVGEAGAEEAGNRVQKFKLIGGQYNN